jgi:hypothetical protein
MAALFICPARHGPTFTVLNLGTMKLMDTYHVWFPAPNANAQWGSIMQSSLLSSEAGGALGGVLQGQPPGTRAAAQQLWSRRPNTDHDVLFEMNPITGVPARILEPEAVTGYRMVPALNSSGELIAVRAPRLPNGEYDMTAQLLPIGRFPPTQRTQESRVAQPVHGPAVDAHAPAAADNQPAPPSATAPQAAQPVREPAAASGAPARPASASALAGRDLIRAFKDLPNDAQLSFLPNAKRQGTASGQRYAAYQGCTTAGQLRAVAERIWLTRDIISDFRLGYLRIAGLTTDPFGPTQAMLGGPPQNPD